MSPVFLLAVGQDPIVLSTRCSILRSAGYMVAEASSIAESLELFKDADFDLVLLCHSIPVQVATNLRGPCDRQVREFQSMPLPRFPAVSNPARPTESSQADQKT